MTWYWLLVKNELICGMKEYKNLLLFLGFCLFLILFFAYDSCSNKTEEVADEPLDTLVPYVIDSNYQKDVDESNKKSIDNLSSLNNNYRLATEADVVYNSSWNGSVQQVEDYLEKTLNDPDSYKSETWYDVHFYYSGPYDYKVRLAYRAKNAFGALILKDQIFYLDGHGNVIDVKDLEDL